MSDTPEQNSRSHSQATLQAALIGFDRALAEALPDLPIGRRQALVNAIWMLIDAVLTQVTLIAYRMDRVRRETEGERGE